MLKKWFRLIKSVSASMLGIQSQKSYEEDFTEQSAVPFIVTGIVLVVAFVVSLILLVNFLV